MTTTHCPTCDRPLPESPSMADTTGHTEACAPCAAGNGLADIFRRDEPEGREWIPMEDDKFPEEATIRGNVYRLESEDRHRAVYRRG